MKISRGSLGRGSLIGLLIKTRTSYNKGPGEKGAKLSLMMIYKKMSLSKLNRICPKMKRWRNTRKFKRLRKKEGANQGGLLNL